MSFVYYLKSVLQNLRFKEIKKYEEIDKIINSVLVIKYCKIPEVKIDPLLNDLSILFLGRSKYVFQKTWRIKCCSLARYDGLLFCKTNYSNNIILLNI